MFPGTSASFSFAPNARPRGRFGLFRQQSATSTRFPAGHNCSAVNNSDISIRLVGSGSINA